ncbi:MULTISPECIES: tetratricopeptide repeat protein [unclassified Pseudomonas]|uniref:tetratricopeptide repeat protein n=1 Tax=unclassified Pseudomonas TaxID=196821 RepID=UPI002113E3DB|nr:MULTISPECIES: sel1 repeat family protein [unclassified Pseudomonas]
MKPLTYLLFVSLFTLYETSFAIEREQAPSSGVVLYNQLKLDAAFPALKKEALSGDIESQYYLGEVLRKRNRYMTPDAQKAYEESAKKGNIYSMIRLGEADQDLCTIMKNCSFTEHSPEEWTNKAKIFATEQASKGSAESMYLLWGITGNDDWLEKSAEGGFALAQFRLATKYQEGGGTFLLPSRRSDAIEKWMKASAENGYPPGMMGYAASRFEKNDLSSFRFWNEKAAASGYVSGVFGYVLYIGGIEPTYGFTFDPVTPYALLTNLLELNGGGNMINNVTDTLPEVEKSMSKEQIAEAKKLAKTWKSTHPPLSFYPEKLGY